MDGVVLDIGGTFVKYGAFAGGEICLRGQFPIREDGAAEEILVPILDFLLAHPAPRVAVSIPGPMDYLTGTSRMTHKFAALQGLSLKTWLESRLTGTRVVFVHDGVAYLLGEMAEGALRGCGCGAGVMLGTGLGFALGNHGRVLIRPETMTPAYPLWNAPYHGATAEDFVSGRGIRRRYLALTGVRLDVHEIAALARAGDAPAAALLSETGAMLGEMLSAHLRSWPVEKIAIGGQIAKSWDLMAPAFAAACSIPAEPAAHIADAALRGAWLYAREGEHVLEARNG